MTSSVLKYHWRIEQVGMPKIGLCFSHHNGVYIYIYL